MLVTQIKQNKICDSKQQVRQDLVKDQTNLSFTVCFSFVCNRVRVSCCLNEALLLYFLPNFCVFGYKKYGRQQWGFPMLQTGTRQEQHWAEVLLNLSRTRAWDQHFLNQQFQTHSRAKKLLEWGSTKMVAITMHR